MFTFERDLYKNREASRMKHKNIKLLDKVELLPYRQEEEMEMKYTEDGELKIKKTIPKVYGTVVGIHTESEMFDVSLDMSNFDEITNELVESGTVESFHSSEITKVMCFLTPNEEAEKIIYTNNKKKME